MCDFDDGPDIYDDDPLADDILPGEGDCADGEHQYSLDEYREEDLFIIGGMIVGQAIEEAEEDRDAAKPDIAQ